MANVLDELLSVVSPLADFQRNKRTQDIEFEAVKRNLETYYDERTSKEIEQLEAGFNEATNISNIDYLLNIYKQNASTYSSNNANKLEAHTAYVGGLQKKKDIEYYRRKIDNMQSKYFGTVDNPGFKDIDEREDEILNWEYDYLADELLNIKDFEAIFFEDYEQETPVKYTYNPNKIRTGDLRRRVEVYKDNIYAAIETLRHDNLITDNEIPYIITGDKAGLVDVKTHYSKIYTEKVKFNRKAKGAIKGNIAKLKEWHLKNLITEAQKEERRGDKTWERVEVKKNMLHAYLESGLNLELQYGTEWDGNTKLQMEDRDDFIKRRIDETLTTNPVELIKEWNLEIEGKSADDILSEREFKKWMGYPMHPEAFDAGKVLQSTFDNQFGPGIGKEKPWGNRISPSSIDELPYDLVSDMESGHYYSQGTGEYYDKETVNALLKL